ncbi:histidine kinase sensor domain-containing protein [Halopseudomonas pachastrellae]|nr:histidine kinase sensor domain-containing protein [Halopseudomonas pachastrellae]
MNRRLWWKLCLTLVVGMLVLFWAISQLALQTEEAMSFIDEGHQQTLRSYAAQAEALHNAGDEQALARWLETVQQQENTWAGVVRTQLTPLGGTVVPAGYDDGIALGRDLSWKIHLYFAEKSGDGCALCRWAYALSNKVAAAHAPRQLLDPLARAAAGGAALYRTVDHLPAALSSFDAPIAQAGAGDRRFRDGDYSARVGNELRGRKDELAGLAKVFDAMAERTEELILHQRQRLDMSHELRTPLTRIEMAVSLARQQGGDAVLLERIRSECNGMRQLVEDALTLSWIEQEAPVLRDESLDLTELLDSLIDDARFEFADRELQVSLPPVAPLSRSSHRALGQAIENVLRNALDHTPAGGVVRLALVELNDSWQLTVSDQGKGVADELLEDIFQPFFRAPQTAPGGAERAGFGLGLALARRQIMATGGSIAACAADNGGLCMVIRLPKG